MKVPLFIVLLLVSIVPASAQQIARLTKEHSHSCTAPCRPTAVVFIHGLNGSAETWGARGASFPSLLNQDALVGPELDIYLVEYDTCFWRNAASIGEVHKALAAQLDPIVVDGNYEKIVLAGHSLGGIVAFRYMNHLKLRHGHGVFARVRLAFTFGSPMEGGNGARLLGLASSCEQLRVLRDIETNDFMQALRIDSTDMLEKRGDRGCPAFSLHAAYEKLGMVSPTVGIVVDERSATAFVRPQWDEGRGFAKNHRDLVKPTGADDEVFLWTRDALRRCIHGQGLCEEPVPESCR